MIRDTIKNRPEVKINPTLGDKFTAKLKAIVNGKNEFSDLRALRDSYADQKGWREGDPRRLGQQDAHEFFNDVLDNIKWERLTLVDTATAPITTGSKPEVMTRSLGNLITESCLPMGLESCFSFQEVVDRYFSAEKMTDSALPFQTNSGTQEITGWYKQNIMLDQPPYIIVQLKRFNSNNAKISAAIQFPKDSEEVLLPCLDEGKKINIKYKISAYILHQGEDLSSGHYVAYVKDDQEDWYFASDKNRYKCDPHAPSGIGIGYSISTEAYIMVLKKV